jgi:hypothetical protein
MPFEATAFYHQCAVSSEQWAVGSEQWAVGSGQRWAIFSSSASRTMKSAGPDSFGKALTAYCLLLTAYRSLLTAHCSLLTAHSVCYLVAMPGWRNGRRYGLKIRWE